MDAAGPVALGRWWCGALRRVVATDAPGDFEIRQSPDRLPGLVLEPVREAKSGKNRLHPDFRPEDQEAEVAPLLAMGARRVDIGQGERSWVVLADIEGNEFCVLSSRHG